MSLARWKRRVLDERDHTLEQGGLEPLSRSMGMNTALQAVANAPIEEGSPTHVLGLLVKAERAKLKAFEDALQWLREETGNA